MVGEDIIRQAREEGARIVADFRARLTLGPEALQFVPEGPPAAEIVKAARRWQADLIVIGSHGRRGIRRALIGSVAEAVVRQAPCPVLVVRANG
jgi:nucleotide-binding universal stress UspA family protein